MHLITFFGPKGGAGRTTSMMATASGLIAADRSVAVLDLTEQAHPQAIVRPSFIDQWEDAMVATGIGPERLVTTRATDHDTADKAIERFCRERFDYVLVDTAKQANPVTTSVMNQSDLVIVPVRGPHEAAWSCEWLTKNRYPTKRTYGLVTGAYNREDERLARATFTGAPMLNASLPKLHTFNTQIKTGMLHAKRWFSNGVPDDEQDRCIVISHDWIAAYSAADALCDEIRGLLDGKSYPAYAVNAPLAVGDVFAHLNALYLQTGYSEPS